MAIKLNFIGTGGFIRIPKACCNCKICKEARIKKGRFERLGQSLFIERENILFDTPEDINTELNKQKIKEVHHIFFTHWHPDHTNGIRIIETLDINRKKGKVIVYLTRRLLKDFKKMVPQLFYFEKQGFCKIKIIKEVKIGKLKIKAIGLKNRFMHGFLISDRKNKVFFCPCHSKEIPILKELNRLNLLIMNLGEFSDKTSEVTNFYQDNLRLIEELKPKKVVLTHIEEFFNKSYTDYNNLENQYKSKSLSFAYDGMKLKI